MKSIISENFIKIDVSGGEERGFRVFTLKANISEMGEGTNSKLW